MLQRIGGSFVERPRTSWADVRDGKNSVIYTPRTPIPFLRSSLSTSSPSPPKIAARKLLGSKNHTEDIGRIHEMRLDSNILEEDSFE